MYPKFKTVSVVVAAVALFYIHGAAFGADDGKAAPVEKKNTENVKATYAAKVNGVEIPQTEIERAIKMMLSQAPQGQEITADMKKMVSEEAVKQLIAAELLYQAGQKLDLKDLDKTVAEKVTESKARFQTPEEFAKALKALEMSEKQMAEYARKDVVITNLVEKEIAAKTTVTEAEAKKFYDDNIDKFKKPESVQASHILITVDKSATAIEKKQAREKIDAILKRVKGGENFAEVAKKESGCPSAAQGGSLGKFGKGSMVPEFEKAAFALKPGEISDVVETQFGFHIIKLQEKQDAETAPFAETKERIQQFLKSKKIQSGVASYVEELKKKAKIEMPSN